MHNLAKIIGPAPANALGEVFLGPADVREVQANTVTIELPHGEMVEALFAFAFPYEPSVGDTLLVIGKDGQHYAIGVLRGLGKAALSFEGNVDLRAVGGKLTLSADQGIEMEAPEVGIRTRNMRVYADKLVQKLSFLHQRVVGLFDVQAKEMHTVVDGETTTRAKSATITTEEIVTINGKQVHLG